MIFFTLRVHFDLEGNRHHVWFYVAVWFSIQFLLCSANRKTSVYLI